jgi:hypothetical protein
VSLKSWFSLQHSYAGTPRPPVGLARASCAASLLLSLFAAAPLAAQQAPGVGDANAEANAPQGAANRAAASRATNDRLRGAGEEDSLLGGPAAYRDPYRAALDAGGTQQSDLMRTERVPNGATNGNGYAPLPRGGRGRVPAVGVGANVGEGAGAPGMAGNAPGGNAAPDAEQAAQPLYRDPFGGANGNGAQVNRSPW